MILIKWRLFKSYYLKNRYLFIKPNYLTKKPLWKNITLIYKPSLNINTNYKQLKESTIKHSNKLMIMSSVFGITTNFDLIRKKSGGTILYSINL